MKLSNRSFKLTILLLMIGAAATAQEFNISVQVNAQNVAQPDASVFGTLERSIQEFFNNTKWTDREYKDHERIDASMIFVVSNFEDNIFQGNFQFSLSRPVFNSTYVTNTFNFKDNDIRFQYVENEPLFYNNAQFESNLISLLSFYAYTMLGIDADTFALRGGEQYHEEAQQVVNLAQSSRNVGWNPNDGNGRVSRYRLNADMLSETYAAYRQVMFDYHLNGLDKFALSPKETKEKLKNYISQFEELSQRRPNNLLQRTFFDAKADEITNIYSGGPAVNMSDFKALLQKLAPNQSSKWRNIKV